MWRAGLLALGAVSSPCAAGSLAGNAETRVLQGTGIAQPELGIPRGNAAATVCAGRGLPPASDFEPAPLYPARGVQAVTLSQPFVAPRLLPGRPCDLTLLGKPLSETDEPGPQFNYTNCSIRFTNSGSRLLIAPKQVPQDWSDRFILAECIYRLAMYVEGYRGALAEPAPGLLQPRGESLLVGRSYVGSSVPWLPKSLSLRCPRILDHYYTDHLGDALERECAKSAAEVSLLDRIAADGYPGVGIAGDERSIDAVVAFASDKNWTVERIIKTRLNIYFGGRPSIAPVAELLQKLKNGGFGSARDTGIVLHGPMYQKPTIAPPR